MLPGLDPLTMTSLLVLAAGAPVCELPERTQINVTPRALEVRYDYSKTLRQIQRYESDSLSPHNFGQISYTQGLMRGIITVAPRVVIKHTKYPDQGVACAWYDIIDVVLEVDPYITIAAEVYEDECMRQAVGAHEMAHVKLDREIINKYAKIMGQKIYTTLEERGFKSNLVGVRALQGTVQRMQETVYEVVNHEYKKMDLERLDRQRALDSKKEYKRMSKQCPDFGKEEGALKRPAKKSYWLFNK